jgi:hypothetical protein
MGMEMRVHGLAVRMTVRMQSFSPTLSERREPKTDQDRANHTLKSAPKRYGDLEVKPEYHQASQEQGHSVTDSPRQANAHRAPQRLLAGHNSGNGNEVIGVKSMLQSKN